MLCPAWKQLYMEQSFLCPQLPQPQGHRPTLCGFLAPTLHTCDGSREPRAGVLWVQTQFSLAQPLAACPELGLTSACALCSVPSSARPTPSYCSTRSGTGVMWPQGGRDRPGPTNLQRLCLAYLPIWVLCPQQVLHQAWPAWDRTAGPWGASLPFFLGW